MQHLGAWQILQLFILEPDAAGVVKERRNTCLFHGMDSLFMRTVRTSADPLRVVWDVNQIALFVCMSSSRSQQAIPVSS